MMENKTAVVKAEDIAHVLRDGCAVLPGSRDRQGRPLLFFPSREYSISVDHVRNVLLYLVNVTSEDARQKGFTVIVDTRGKQTWNNVKPLLKTLNQLVEQELASVHKALVIESDKFWEKHKPKLTSYVFETPQIPFDQLSKYFDSTQLPRELGGSYPYNHDDWLETRLELEKWIWHVTEVMRSLDSHRRSMCDAESATDVRSAEAAITRHLHVRAAVLAIPIDRIQNDANRIISRMERPASNVPNPDLLAAHPHMINLQTSLVALKNKVFTTWEARRAELECTHLMKSFESDAEAMLDWLRNQTREVTQRLSEVGLATTDTEKQLVAFAEFTRAAKNAEVNMEQLKTTASRVLSILPEGSLSKTKIERLQRDVTQEWSHLTEMLTHRQSMLEMTISFHRSSQEYKQHLPQWLRQSGSLDASSVDSNNAEQLEEAIRAHDKLCNQVEEFYAEAAANGNQLSQLLRGSEAGEAIKDQLTDIIRSQKQLHAELRQRKIRLCNQHAYLAFQTDGRQVVEWLEQHGEPFLQKNTNIGESLGSAQHLLRTHNNFRAIAQNTYKNAEKLFVVSRTISASDVVDQDSVRTIMKDLEARITQFRDRVESRHSLLSQSVLFHTHYNELLSWYRDMEQKYGGWTVPVDVANCEHAKETWVLETDAASQAYNTTIGEGQQLVRDLGILGQRLNIDYSNSVQHITELLGNVEQANQHFISQWPHQRVMLHIAVNVAYFVRDNQEVLTQITNWEEDMHGLINSPTFVDNAEAVEPFHVDNTAKVRAAVNDVKDKGLQIMQRLHDSQQKDLKMNTRELVRDLVTAHLRKIEAAEQRVMRIASDTSKRIKACRKFICAKKIASDLIRCFENEVEKMDRRIPSSDSEARADQQRHELMRASLKKYTPELETSSWHKFCLITHDLLREGLVDRNDIVEVNEVLNGTYRKLLGITEERRNLIRTAEAHYRVCEAAVTVANQMEREYNRELVDYCQQLPKDVPLQAQIDKLLETISSLNSYREKLLKCCSYAQKSSDTFLKYVRRSNASDQERKFHERTITGVKGNLRDRLSAFLDIWNRRKKHIDRCHQYLLLRASAEQIVGWVEGEGEARLAQFQRHSKQMSADTAESIREDFLKYKITVKEKRQDTLTFLHCVTQGLQESEEHTSEIAACAAKTKQCFEAFSKRVLECEAALGRKGSVAQMNNQKNEFSLDRQSDQNVGEKLEKQKKIGNEKMREPMRELIKSEKDYVEDLRRCVQVYVAEFDKATAATSLPSGLRGRRKDIFGNIEDIFEFHANKFVHEIAKYEDDPEEVGCSFSVWVDLLNQLYTDYCVNKEQNNHVIAVPEAMQFFGNIREKHKLDMSHDLGSLLIKPVQRITRYKLMIEQLLKNCTHNLDEIREAFEVVSGVPRRANDIIHLGCLDYEKYSASIGPFVMQDALTVFEPRNYFKKGKDRQVFLFELAIVLAKRADVGSRTVRYLLKAKPIPLGSVVVVEHVEGDPCRFGLRVGGGGFAMNNDNRTDFRTSTETQKVNWVKKIRELIADGGLLPMSNMSTLDVASTNSSLGVSTRSTASVSSGGTERMSRDADAFSLDNHRHSIQSSDSEIAADQWFANADYEATAENQLTVRKGDRVLVLEQQAADGADMVQVCMVDDASKAGLVPHAILMPDQQPSSSTDRPDVSPSSSSVTKRKSLRRIFANSGSTKESRRESPAAQTVVPATVLSTASCSAQDPSVPPTPALLQTNNIQDPNPSVLSSTAAPVPDTNTDHTRAGVEEDPLDGLPPPMEQISDVVAEAAASTQMTVEEDSCCSSVAPPAEVVEAVRESVESEENGKKEEKTPEEMARFKRLYVIRELVETEQDYVKDLTSVVEGYIANLEKMELPQDLVGKDKIIFANIAQILEFHKTCFLKEIEKASDNYEAAGQAFIKYERRLHSLYVKYCQNKPKSDYLVAQDEFEAFFAETKLKLGHKVALCDLLIKPVQRIMKYQLLLKDILKFTERAGDRADAIKKALGVMHVVPKACDEMMQVGRLQEFEGNLSAQGKLVHQGTLPISEVVGGQAQRAKDRRIFLFEQSVIIADHIAAKKEFANDTYIFKNQIMVNKMQFMKDVDEPLKFTIGSSDPTHPQFVAHAQSQEEKDEWIRRLDDIMDQQKRLLAALMDPKRFYGSGSAADDLGQFGNMNIADKKAGGPSAAPKSPAAKAESPKKEKGSKLFGFGKKNAKSPTSPPPVGKLK